MAVVYTSGYQIDDLRSLDECIAGCVLRIEIRGKVITYKSLNQLKQARQCVYEALINEGVICPPSNQRRRSRFYRAQCDDGFGKLKGCK